MPQAIYLVTILLLSSIGVLAQSGGSFAITQSVIAGGGSDSSGGTFQVTGTIGQPVAGANASGGTFAVQAGFWAGAALAPTAATVGVSGRVVDAAGSPLRNVVVSLSDSTGGVIITRSNSFGYFTFAEVQSGQTYIVNITARTHQFAPQVVSVNDSLTNLEFRALP